MIPGLLHVMSPGWLPTLTAALQFAQCWDWKTSGKPSYATKRFEGRNVITSDAQRVECSRTYSPIARTAPLLSIRRFRKNAIVNNSPRTCRNRGQFDLASTRLSDSSCDDDLHENMAALSAISKVTHVSRGLFRQDYSTPSPPFAPSKAPGFNAPQIFRQRNLSSYPCKLSHMASIGTRGSRNYADNVLYAFGHRTAVCAVWLTAASVVKPSHYPPSLHRPSRFLRLLLPSRIPINLYGNYGLVE